VFNICVIAGYDVLADQSLVHEDYIKESVSFSMWMDADLIILLGGATNPDYPKKTEAEANYRIIQKAFGDGYRVSLLNRTEVSKEKLNEFRTENDKIAESFGPKTYILIVKLDLGDTSAQTLRQVWFFLTERAIPVKRLIYCSEMARSTGFSLDGLFEDVNQKAGPELITYGHRFPDTQKDFEKQKQKMLLKVLSHRYSLFERFRLIQQKRHQKKVAKQKRKESETPRS
jgi:hypothetical protein